LESTIRRERESSTAADRRNDLSESRDGRSLDGRAPGCAAT